MSLVRKLNLMPFAPVGADFDVMVNRLFNGDWQPGATPNAIDVREDADHLYVDAELPGFKKEEVEITLEKSVLTLVAEKKGETPAENGAGPQYLIKERRYTRFERSLRLPPTVDEGSVNASLENGVLTVTLKKREESKPRRITVA